MVAGQKRRVGTVAVGVAVLLGLALPSLAADEPEDMFRERRSLFFKKMQIVRGCDSKRNVLVYMVYSDRLIEGSPKNSTSSVPISPWGACDQIQCCADFVEK